MPPKKRPAPAAAEILPKRRKHAPTKSSCSSSQSQRSGDSNPGELNPASNPEINLTQFNAAHSPLLRLPTELRDQIWKYIFADLVIHPRTRAPHHPPTLHYFICYTPAQTRDLYSWSLLGARPGSPRTWASPDLEVAETGCYCPSSKRFCVPMVCKQFYYEVLPIVFSTCIFSFRDRVDLHTFALSPSSHVSDVQNISLEIFSPAYFSDWNPTLTISSIIDQFRSLKSVKLTLNSQSFGSLKAIPTNLLAPPKMLPNGAVRTLFSIICALQQFQLEAEKTTVVVQQRRRGADRITELRALAEQVRRHLLHHRPRRRSKRLLGESYEDVAT
ncbi:uncharacterized protein BDR25DRAFT_340031 [Lindgomyces ingoldianus]|uniref:Uncharacterized protein n=1 Tax=Lindgomyces ingoldianus TaxID=673940 RepID=A0ACB6R9L0_9PLEO|nr:uncharacterized protein BDR25DRAFT_340031 [Lindgomyces ingoldianus]KAF2475146.1 hypothetical protein BDR25DRAFT_340031 [Lindgomyces ingoldianus]